MLRAVGFTAAAIYLLFAARRNPLAYLVSGALLAYALGEGFTDGPHSCAVLAEHDLASLVTMLGLLLACLSFPDGRIHGRGTRLLVAVWVVTNIAVLYPVGLPWTGLGGTGWGFLIEGSLLVAGLFALGRRYLYHATQVEQAQLRWLGFAVSIALAAMAVRELRVIPAGVPAEIYSGLIYKIVVLAMPAALTVGLLGYGLWELDRVYRNIARGLFGLAVVAAVGTMTGRAAHMAVRMGFADSGELGATLGGGLLMLAVLAVYRRGFTRIADLVLFPKHHLTEDVEHTAVDALGDCRDPAEAAAIVRAAVGEAWSAPSATWRFDGERLSPLGRRNLDVAAPRRQDLPRFKRGRRMTLFRGPTPRGSAGTIALPLCVQDELVGVLMVGPMAGERGYPAEQLERMLLLAGALADVLHRDALSSAVHTVLGPIHGGDA
jgi:hypothetical protein